MNEVTNIFCSNYGQDEDIIKEVERKLNLFKRKINIYKKCGIFPKQQEIPHFFQEKRDVSTSPNKIRIYYFLLVAGSLLRNL